MFITLLIFFPIQSFAVEFSITNVKIDAHLKNNGNVNVEETFTYDFEGDFNGISRLLISKNGSLITDFTASEKGVPLIVEEAGEYYNIHRKGSDETVIVKINYTIINGVEVYEDYAQFYWPFFSRENEANYDNFTITVYPPQTTRDVIAFGYDEAFTKETIKQNGTVVFNFGKVLRKTNGDIRVGYEAGLFDEAPLITGQIREELIDEHESLIIGAESRLKTREALTTIARIALPAYAFILLFLIVKSALKVRTKQSVIIRETKLSKAVPIQVMSLPATILFTNYNHFSPQVMAAALLDLVRQGYVKKKTDDHFQVVDREGTLHHERLLINWLFYTIGRDGHFHFSHLKKYTKNEKNHSRYHTDQTNWQKAVKEEIQAHALFENSKNYRIWVGFSSLILFPFLILFPVFDLVLAFIVTLSLFSGTILYALAYRPKSYEGEKITYEWKQFREQYKHLTQTDWERWSEDERMRAYIYGLGIHVKTLRKKNEELIKAFRSPILTNNYSYTVDVASMAYMGPIAFSNFKAASSTTSVSSSSSSGTTSTGSGAGGGGGGSGAF